MERARQDEQATREASLTQDALSLQERQATQKAIKLLEAKEVAGGGESLREARDLLEEGLSSQKAAEALMAIAGDASIERTEVERAVRDVVVLRGSSPATLEDRSAFLKANGSVAAEAHVELVLVDLSQGPGQRRLLRKAPEDLRQALEHLKKGPRQNSKAAQ